MLWKYNYGDGFLSTQKDPAHIYRKPGTYTVKLTVRAFGLDKKLMTNTTELVDYITVT